MAVLKTIRKSPSLMYDYLYYSAIVVFGIVMLFSILAYVNLENIKEEREIRYIHELNKITGELRESFKYLEMSMDFTANKILNLPDKNNLKDIAEYLKKSSRFPRMKDDVFSWNLFEFISPSGYILADSINGALKEPIRVDYKHRKWLELCKSRPRRIHFSDPDLGASSDDDIISTGYGVTDGSNLIGILGVGFNIEKFARKIDNILGNSGVVFIVVDEKFRVIAQSNYHRTAHLDNLTENLKDDKILYENKGILNRPLKYKGGSYKHYMRIQYSPYTIIVGDLRIDLKGEFLRDFVPQVLQSLSLICIFLTLFYFLRSKVILPIVALSEVADKISQSEENVTIPETSTIEMHRLAMQLERLMIYTKDLREAKKMHAESQNELQNALKMVEEEKRSKEIMLNNLAFGLKVPAHKVLNYAEYLVANISKTNPKNPIIKGWKEVANTARYIQTLVLDLLEYTRSKDNKIMLSESNINLITIIEDSIDIVKMFANENFIEIDFQYGHIPLIFADELRLKQVMVNLLTRAIISSRNGAIIFISCFYDEELTIIIKDQRYLNLDNKENLKENPFVSDKYTQEEEINFSLEMVKKLLTLHGCKIKIWNEDVGQSVIISFPDRRVLSPQH